MTQREKRFWIEKSIRDNQYDDSDPFVGGYNSQQAYFVHLELSNDPKYYNGMPIKEKMMIYQDMLQTGGINTNMFKVRRRKRDIDKKVELVTLAVNDKQTAQRVAEFFQNERPMVQKISLGSANSNDVIEVTFPMEDPTIR